MADHQNIFTSGINDLSITPNAEKREARDIELPISDKNYWRLGLGVLAIAFGGFGGWALSAELAVSVVAPGIVSVESYKKKIQHFEGGIVSEFLIHDGDHVDAGDTLIMLDNTQALSQLRIAKSQYNINRAIESRLLAERNNKERLSFPKSFLTIDPERLNEILAVQKNVFLARRQSLHGTLASLDQQNIQLTEQIAGLEDQVAINQQLVASLIEETNDFRLLFKEGLADNQRLRELEREIFQHQSTTAQHKAEIARLRSRIIENKELKRVRMHDFYKEVGAQLREAQGNIADAKERVTALSEKVQRTIIKAPVSGTVVGLRVHTLGAVVGAGETILDIVPSDVGFVVEARIPTHEIDHIYRGQFAEIRFSAFNQHLSNIIEGEVTYVSADSFKDEITGTLYYKVRINVTQAGAKEMTESMNLLAGMPAEVMIRTGERTFASYIAKPIIDMLARAVREG